MEWLQRSRTKLPTAVREIELHKTNEEGGFVSADQAATNRKLRRVAYPVSATGDALNHLFNSCSPLRTVNPLSPEIHFRRRRNALPTAESCSVSVA